MSLTKLCRPACVVALLALAAPAPAQVPNEPAIRKAIAAKFPNAKVESIGRGPFPGLLELIVDGNVFYADDKFTYIVNGSLIDTKSWQNVTSLRKEQLEAKQFGPIQFKDLPLKLAVRQVRGNGKRVLATFEDPNCGFCRQFHGELAKLTDATIYIFLYPIIAPPDSVEKSRAVWCSKDRGRAWDTVMVTGKLEPAPADCKAPIDEVLKLGDKLNVRSTPTIFLSDGQRIRGALPVAQLEEALRNAGKGAAKK
jgi:thiol:disulfide interchange protein DsbC